MRKGEWQKIISNNFAVNEIRDLISVEYCLVNEIQNRKIKLTINQTTKQLLTYLMML